ncbi:hypothetical protein [Caldisericum sp.]|jgi:hypothetical protein|uniref:hypothetical protein n=1 Tax=Caldisericum sp. TaxID=2499687 RepID=UPI003D1008BA
MTSLEKKNRELTVLLDVCRVLSSSFEIEKNLYQALKILSEYLIICSFSALMETSERVSSPALILTEKEDSASPLKILSRWTICSLMFLRRVTASDSFPFLMSPQRLKRSI